VKAYSLDFRQKIIDAYRQGDISQRQLAGRFDVALSFIEKLIKQYKETGDIAPKSHSGGQSPALTPEQIQIVAELVAANHDATLATLCDQLVQVFSIYLRILLNLIRWKIGGHNEKHS